MADALCSARRENPFAVFGCGMPGKCHETPIYSISRFEVDCEYLVPGEKHSTVVSMYFCHKHLEDAKRELDSL
jgi:hypothetical protein